MASRREDVLFLFDVDGTLTAPRQIIHDDLYNYLIKEVKGKVSIGLVGGSDMVKILEQMGRGDQALTDFDYVFSENGMVAYGDGKVIGEESIQNFMGEEVLQKFINFALGYMSKLTLPVKRGNFIEFRKGMINVCPVGRSCSQAERIQFFEHDKEHKTRLTFIEALRNEFPDLGLKFSVGGQISIDVFPIGWDKTFCLKFLDKFQTIHFFGDRTEAGENDHEIYVSERTVGHRVTSPDDTKQQVANVLKSL